MQRPLLLLLACSLVAAFPLHQPAFLDPRALLSIDLNRIAHPLTQHPKHISKSAELLFTAGDDDEIVHVWLPLGKRIRTGGHSILPLHPATAKIVNVSGVSTRTPVRSKQQQVTCIIKTRANRLQHRAQAELDVAFQEGDGVVRLNEASSAYDLTGREAESYECF